MGIKNKELTYTIVDALSFLITGATKTLEVEREGSKIKALKNEDGLNIHLGLTVQIKKQSYLVNLIEESEAYKGTKYKVSMAQRTKTSLFALPMLGGNRKLFFWDKYLVNCFIGKDEDEDCIFLLYRFSSKEIFLEFEKALSKFKNFKRKEDPAPEYVMFIFEIPDKHKRNFKKLLKGKYSKLTKKYKMEILEFHGQGTASELGQVLFQDTTRKELLEFLLGAPLPEDSELMSVLDLDKEVFNIEKYKLKKLL